MSLDTQKLVDLLVDARRSGQPVHLPPSLRPAGVAEGYAVAAQLVLLQDANDLLFAETRSLHRPSPLGPVDI
jgi:hypothetical protein